MNRSTQRLTNLQWVGDHKAGQLSYRSTRPSFRCESSSLQSTQSFHEDGRDRVEAVNLKIVYASTYLVHRDSVIFVLHLYCFVHKYRYFLNMHVHKDAGRGTTHPSSCLFAMVFVCMYMTEPIIIHRSTSFLWGTTV